MKERAKGKPICRERYFEKKYFSMKKSNKGYIEFLRKQIDRQDGIISQHDFLVNYLFSVVKMSKAGISDEEYTRHMIRLNDIRKTIDAKKIEYTKLVCGKDLEEEFEK